MLNMGEVKLSIQKNILAQLIKDQSNFKKAGESRRTKNYLNCRLVILEDNFKTSTQYNAELLGSADLKKETVEELFDLIKDTYIDYRAELLDALDKVQGLGPSLASGSGLISRTSQE